MSLCGRPTCECPDGEGDTPRDTLDAELRIMDAIAADLEREPGSPGDVRRQARRLRECIETIDKVMGFVS